MSDPTKSVIPAYMQHLDPEVRAAKERELQKAGSINKTEYNPQGKLMHDFVGTPVKTQAEIDADVIIKADREVAMEMTQVLKRAENLCRDTRTRARYVDAIRAALDSVDAAIVAEKVAAEDAA